MIGGKMNQFRLIACDLDETLLGADRAVSAKNAEAVKKAMAAGVKFVPATGRGYRSVGNVLDTLGLADKENEYVISFNGGAITENKDSRLLHFEGLSFALAKDLYLRGIQYNVCVHVYTKDMVYAYRLWQEEIDYLAGRMGITETFEKTLDFLEGEDIVKMLYMNTDYAYLKQIEKDLEHLTSEIDISYSANRYIEFNKKGVTKGSGMMALANLLGIKREETIAIGDNFNDLSMIQAAGLGVCVQNAVEEMKPLCGYVTKAAYDESAVAEVIEKFVC